MAEYDAGEAFIRLVPSFRGVAEQIDREAEKWGIRAGERFNRGFDDTVRRNRPPAPGPSDEESRRKGDESAKRFGEGFKARLRAESFDAKVNINTGPAMAGIAKIKTALLGLSAGAAITPFIGGAAALLAPAAGVGIGAAGAGGVVANAEAQITKANAARQSLQKAQAAAASKQFTGTPKQQAAQRAAAQKTVAQSQSQYKAAFGQLTPAEQALSKAQDALKTSFQGWAQSLETTVLPVLSQAFKIAKPLLDIIEPLVVSVSGALHGALQRVGADVKSAGFDRFIVTLDQLVRPAIRTGVTVVENLGKAFGSLVTAAAPLAPIVEHGLTALTGHLATAAKSPGLTKFFDTLSKLGPTVVSTVSAIGGLGAHLLGALAPLSGPVLRVIGTLARALSQLLVGVGPSLTRMFRLLAPIVQELIAALLPPLTSLLKQVAGAIPSLAQGFVDVVKALLPLVPVIGSLLKFLGPLLQFLAPLAPYILAVVVATKAWTAVQVALKAILPLLIDEEAALNGVLAANPIGLVVIALAALVAGFILAWKHSETFRRIVVDVLNFVKNVAMSVVHWFSGPFVRFFTETIPRVFTTAVHFIERIWSDVWTFVKRIWHDVASWFVSAWRSFTGFVSRIWGDITGAVSSAWHGMVNGIKSAWKAVSSWLSGAWHALAGTASRVWHDIAHGVTSAFGAVEGFFVNLWYRIERIFANAVNFVTQDLLNPLIRLLDTVLHVFGVNIHQIPKWHVSAPARPYTGPLGNDNGGGGQANRNSGGRAYARGGVEPGYAPGQDIRWARVSPGEGFLVPEAVRGLGGERAVNAINAHFSPRVRAAGGGQRNVGGVPHFFLGGVFSGIGHAAMAAVHAIRNVTASVAYHALQVAEKPVTYAIDKLAPKSFASTLAHGVFDRLNTAVRDFIRGNAGSAMFGGAAGVGGAGWKAIWENLKAQHFTPIQAAGIMGNIQSESGGNPFIIQGGGTSMNPAAAGQGGYGLVQWTPGAKLIPYLRGGKPSVASEIFALATQLANRGPFPEGSAGLALSHARTPEDAANIFGLQYERYAGPPQAQRAAQARGFFDRFNKYDSGGFLPPGITAAINNTGRPELVLTADQQQALFDNRGQQPITQVIQPAARMSEYEIATIAANQLSFLMRSR